MSDSDSYMPMPGDLVEVATVPGSVGIVVASGIGERGEDVIVLISVEGVEYFSTTNYHNVRPPKADPEGSEP
ncbi:hypothetical protein AB3662_28940 [Sorangium cellulosum]|uniref:hypothetical protein n=1 Tax=Sorangium cellulosum TaxID=56 RepID=UPI003D9A6A46